MTGQSFTTLPLSIKKYLLISTYPSHLSFRAKREPVSWLNKSIRTSMRAWDEARRPYRSHPSFMRRDICSLCNEIKCHIDETKIKYLLNRSSITNSARFWAELRSLGFAKSKTTNSFLKFSLDHLNSLLSLFPLIFCFLHLSYLLSSLLLIFADHRSQFIVPLLTPVFLILPFLTLLIYPF